MYNLIPDFIVKNYINNNMHGRFESAVMFVDISGFTALTEILSQHKKEGVEALSGIINYVFSFSIDSVYKNNGFITHFAGDSFNAVFPSDCLGAAYSAKEISDFIKSFDTQDTIFGEIQLNVKTGLSYGEVNWGIVGNETHKAWYFCGNGIDGASRAENECSFEDVILDRPLFNKIFQYIDYSIVDTEYFKLLGFKDRPPNYIDITGTFRSDTNIKNLFYPDLPDQIIDEFREVCSLFISFKDLDNDHSLLNNFAKQLLDLTDKFGGFLTNLRFGDKGSNALVLFGAPVSYEDNIFRCLECIHGLRTLFSDNIRAGISFGKLFAGIIGSKQRNTYDVLGDSVNLASRLAVNSKWGETLFCRNILNTAERSFDHECLGIRTFKGRSTHTEIFLLKDRKAKVKKLYSNKFIGRNKELKDIKNSIQNIFHNSFGGFVYVYGDAGSGKSRLVYEAVKQNKNDISLITLQCNDISILPWNPIIEYFYQYFGINRDMLLHERMTRFNLVFGSFLNKMQNTGHEYAGPIMEEIMRTMPYFKNLLSITSPEYEKANSKQRYQNTIYAIKEFLKGQSIIRPVLIIIEDIQWMDISTKELLTFVSRNIRNFPIAFLCTGRYSADGSKPFIKTAEEDIPSKYIDLDHLSDKDIICIMKDILNHAPSKELSEYIIRNSPNNPFFIEQFCEYMKENNLLYLRDDHYYLTDKITDVPSTINQLIVARIDSLSREMKELLKIASVLGAEFEKTILKKMISNISNNESFSVDTQFDFNAIRNIGDPKTDIVINDAEKQRLIQSIDPVKYLFKHILICQSAYDMQLKDRLRKTHDIAGTVIENLLKQDENLHKDYYTELAYHFSKAENKRKAAQYLERSADYLKENYKNMPALEQYLKLLDITKDKEKIITVKQKIAQIYQLLGSWQTALKYYNETIELALQINNSQMLAESYKLSAYLKSCMGDYHNAEKLLLTAIRLYREIGDKKGEGTSLGFLAINFIYRDLNDEAYKCLMNVLKISKETGNDLLASSTYLNLGIVSKTRSRYKKAIRYYEQCRKLSCKTGDKAGQRNAIGNLATIYRFYGHFQKSLELYQEDEKLSKNMGDKVNLVVTINNIGKTYYEISNYQKSESYYLKALNIAEEIGFPIGKGHAYMNLAVLYYAMGKFERFLKNIDKAIDIFTILNNDLLKFDAIMQKIRYLEKIGDKGRLSQLCEYALKLAEKIKAPKLILDIKIIIIKNTQSTKEAIDTLLNMLPESGEVEKATIFYNLFQLSKDKEYKKQALKLYEKFYYQTRLHDYKKRIDELSDA